MTHRNRRQIWTVSAIMMPPLIGCSKRLCNSNLSCLMTIAKVNMKKTKSYGHQLGLIARCIINYTFIYMERNTNMCAQCVNQDPYSPFFNYTYREGRERELL